MNPLLRLFALGLVLFATSAHAGWQQTFVDNVDGTSLDTSKWVNTNYWGQHNRYETGEKQCYMDELVSVGSGSVALTAISGAPAGCNPDPGILTHQSGVISTANNFRQLYGYFEVRAKMPKGKGLWPQFRLEIPGGSFPPRPPEIIAAETYGSASQVRHSYEEYDPSTDVYTSHPLVTNTSFDVSADFHTYGVDWQPGLIIYYIDGVETGRYASPAIYNQPLYIILNLAIGGNFVGDPDASTVFPAKMQIDYVKAYARINDGNPDTLPPGVNPPVPADTVAPKVAIVLPFKDVTVKRKTTIVLAAVATDNVKVTNVTFSVNGVNVCSNNKPYEACKWQVPATTSVSSYVIKATAKDAAGNQGVAQVKLTAK